MCQLVTRYERIDIYPTRNSSTACPIPCKIREPVCAKNINVVKDILNKYTYLKAYYKFLLEYNHQLAFMGKKSNISILKDDIIEPANINSVLIRLGLRSVK